MTSPSNCPNVLANGTCDDKGCPHTHTMWTCEPCGFVFQSADLHDLHLATKKHHSKISGRSVVSYCSICEANVSGGQEQWKQHIQGRNHRQKALSKGVSSDVVPQPATTTSSSTACDLCQIVVPTLYWTRHLNNEKHQSREQFTRYMTAVEQSETDKNGVVVEGLFDFDFIDPPVAQVGKITTISIKTSQPFSKSVLLEAKLASAQGNSGISSFSVRITSPNRDIRNLRPLTLVIGFKQVHIGRYQDRLELIFEDTQLKKRFIITRALKAIVGNKAEHEELRPKAPYVPRSRSNRIAVLEVVEGVKPPATSIIPYVVPLPQAPIPDRLRSILSGKDSVAKITGQIKNIFIPRDLDSSSYGQHFKHLLWIEEFKMEQDIERYDMTNATLSKHNHLYYLSVPGLAEKRPSVLVGDCILVQEQGATGGRWFEGHVHVLRQTEVGLQFHGSFGAYAPGRRFHIRFKLSRIPVRRQHQAMNAVFTEDRVLFPLITHLPGGRPPSPSNAALKVFNPLISSNGPQLQAVVSVVAQRPGSHPFVVFGPPGTGKTITIVECIKQILITYPQAKVLACAPSNSAADLIACRLQGHLGANDLFRFYAPSRFKDQAPDELLPYTCVRDGHFTVPTMARLKGFRVIVSTCVSASVCSNIGMARGHFTHIFIDEAGQATEPEAFVSIKLMADSKTNVILSGDPKQLGPVIRSGIARELGLEKSFLERLMDRDAYNIQTGYGRSVVKLVKNFRSHNAILHFPNERFYLGDLVPCGNPAVINSYLKSQYLPSKKFPIVFHAVSGKDDREASSPSFFNIDEVLQVKSYVQKLKEDRKFRTTDKDIGIIAPYHAQCLKLRNSLRSVADGIKVGSVEEFQGQERRVIIISTVRSSKAFVEYDLRHTLGFVANPRRFNVAITRAQALLIIVGDPQVLSLDPLWRAFLNYIYVNGGWTGPDITWDPRAEVDEAGGYDKQVRDNAQIDMNEFTRRMESVTLGGVDEELDANVDRPWTRENE
ncbi:RNA helicase [Phlegmacium glaucopus]|nr:RNA helicase [Phlegmacium glaucopus]